MPMLLNYQGMGAMEFLFKLMLLGNQPRFGSSKFWYLSSFLGFWINHANFLLLNTET